MIVGLLLRTWETIRAIDYGRGYEITTHYVSQKLHRTKGWRDTVRRTHTRRLDRYKAPKRYVEVFKAIRQPNPITGRLGRRCQPIPITQAALNRHPWYRQMMIKRGHRFYFDSTGRWQMHGQGYVIPPKTSGGLEEVAS